MVVFGNILSQNLIKTYTKTLYFSKFSYECKPTYPNGKRAAITSFSI